eukprot:5251802-Pyramimonas_sp.AAC.1
MSGRTGARAGASACENFLGGAEGLGHGAAPSTHQPRDRQPCARVLKVSSEEWFAVGRGLGPDGAGTEKTDRA